jgi:hypothetical protein
MAKSEQVRFLSADVAEAASNALERIQCAGATLAVVEAGVYSAALVQALRLSGNCGGAELDRLLLIFEAAADVRLRAVKQSRRETECECR